MATQSTVTGPIQAPTATTPTRGFIRFQLTDWDAEGGTIITATKVEAPISDQDFSISLWASSEGDRGTNYKVTAFWYNSTEDKWVQDEMGYCSVGTSGPYELGDILVDDPIYPADIDYATAAALSAAEASGYADAAAASAAAVEYTYQDIDDLQANAISGGDGTIHTTRKEGFSYVEDSSDPDFTVNGIGVKYIPGHAFDMAAFPLSTAEQYLAALKIGCASKVINVICPAAELYLASGYDGTIPCAKRKRLIVRDGVLVFNIPPTGSKIMFTNLDGALGDRSFFESDSIRFIRDNSSTPTGEEKNAVVMKFETTTLHGWEASGSRGFHITISNAKFATFDQCYAHDGYLGLLGPSGTDGMHAIGCQFVKWYRCRAHDLGDDGMSVGRDVQAAGNQFFYDWCEQAVVEDCEVSNIKTASVKAYARVRNLTIRGGTLEGGLGGAVWLVSGHDSILDAGVPVGVEHVKINGTHFVNCRGWMGNSSSGDTVGAVYTLRQVSTSRNPQSFKTLTIEGCTLEDCAQVLRDDLYETVKVVSTSVRRAIYKYPETVLSMWLFQFGDLNGRGDGTARADISVTDLSIDGMDRYVQILRTTGGSRYGKRASVRMSDIYMRDVASVGARTGQLIWLEGWAHYNIRGISGDNVNADVLYHVTDASRIHPLSYIEFPNRINITGINATEDGYVGTLLRGPYAVVASANVAGLPNASYPSMERVRQAPWMTGEEVEWLVTASGTKSSVDISGVICTADVGSKNVYVNDPTVFAPGQYVTVGGVSTFITEITDASGGEDAYLTLRNAVSSSVSGAGTIVWTAPTFRQFASVAAT